MTRSATRSALPVAGFTLIELLVAIAVGSLVALTAAATAAAVPEIGTRADDRVRETLETANVRTQIREWFLDSYVSRDSTFDASFAGIDGPGPGSDAIQFTVVGPTPSIDGRAVITLGIDAGDSGRAGGLVADIRPERGRAERLVLVPGATALEARYLYFVSGDPRWFAGWSSEVERPAAVRLFVAGGQLAPLQRLPLTVWLAP